jgi:hypothetical protein
MRGVSVGRGHLSHAYDGGGYFKKKLKFEKSFKKKLYLWWVGGLYKSVKDI